METDGFLNEFSFQCQCRVGEDGRRGLPSAEVMQDAMDGMVAENKSSAANSNNGRCSAKGRESEGARGRKGPHFASSTSPSSALLSGIISRRHLTILKTPERLHISRNRTIEASRFLPHADLVRTFTTFVLLLSRVSVR